MNTRIYLVALLSLLPYVNLFAQEEKTADPGLPADKIYTSLQAALSNPDSVYRLDLSRKKLKVIPAEVFRFRNLYELNVSRNRLESLPPEIGQLTGLKILKASNNNLKALPREIGNLTLLTHLELNRNLIVTLPPEIGQLQNLETLELWDNEIDSIPEELKNLKKLQVLELRGILFTEEEQQYIQRLVPDCRVYFSPSCLCKD